jgi:hypothetical protein
MTVPSGRFDYAPINDRPIIKWPNDARVAFWVALNMEFFETEDRTEFSRAGSYARRALLRSAQRRRENQLRNYDPV